jgi:hypothetical protein
MGLKEFLSGLPPMAFHSGHRGAQMEFLSGLPLMAFRSGHRGGQNHFALQDDLPMVVQSMTLEGNLGQIMVLQSSMSAMIVLILGKGRISILSLDTTP